MARKAALSLKRYYWQGRESSGKDIASYTLASCAQEVRDQLSEQKVRLKSMRSGSISLFDRRRHIVKVRDINVFTRQLATLLESGFPVLNCLTLLAKQSAKAELTSIIYLLSKRLEAGETLADSLKHIHPIFDALYLALVAVGEQTGQLAKVLHRVANYQERRIQLQAKVTKALLYPGVMLISAIGVSYLMMIWVIPEFEALFSDFSTPLPWFTQQFIGLSRVLRHAALPILVSVLLLSWAARRSYYRNPKVALICSRLILRLPMFGKTLDKACIARVSRTIATNQSCGIALLTNLTLAANTANNRYYQDAILRSKESVLTGTSLHAALREQSAFPELFLQMVMIGEESGRLDSMLEKLSALYEADVDDQIDRLNTILEPILILLLGGIIGSLVVAMYLPIFNLTQILG